MFATYFGIKGTIAASWSISAAGGLSLALFQASASTPAIASMILVAKLGVSGAFGLVYLGTSQAFPPLYVSSVFGACSIASRSFTTLAPEVAKVEEPYPMVVYASLSILAIVLIQFLEIKREDA